MPKGKVFSKGFLEQCKKYIPLKDTLEQIQFIEKILRLKPGMKILDLACGWGRHSIELAKRGYKVVGTDINPLYIKEAKRLAQKLGLEINWIEGDMRKVLFQKRMRGRFDVVLNLSNSFGYFEKEKDHQETVYGISKVLKPKGFFLLDIKNLESLIYHYQPEQKKHLSKEHFLIIKSSFDFLSSRWNEEVIEFLKGKKKRKTSYSIRAFTIKELISLSQESNLLFKKIYGGFKEGPLSLDSERCILVFQKNFIHR
ncbi:class I SAM-dependent methyltransferase [bacterium]|nr:class I SAM-dependent methyltransferase [bacterium]